MADAIGAALFPLVVFGDVTGGIYPISKPGGGWRAFVMAIIAALPRAHATRRST